MVPCQQCQPFAHILFVLWVDVIRIAASGELSNRVIFADVDRFEWIEDQTSGYRKVGFR